MTSPTLPTTWFRDAKLGLFVHWGPVSILGTEITCSRIGGPGPDATVPAGEYDALYRRFNPTKFDAGTWVEIAASMGARYLVFTAKHGDGFCMFDSGLTDYTVTHSPFRRDVAAELADAVHARGLKLGFYYSPSDWHHPDFRTADHRRYVEYLHGQVRELCSNYGTVDVVWFDSRPEWAGLWDAPAMFRIIRELQPNALVNDRGGLPGDFDTPEQEVGVFQNMRPWESCVTIGEQWSYKPDDRVKTTRECVQTLVRCACGDGNLLLNVGPMDTGEIEPRQVRRLREMGDWLRRHGETIYDTRGGPFVMGSRGGSTCRDKTVYLHLLEWPQDTIRLPPIDARILSFRSLTGGTAGVRQSGSGIEVSMPEHDRDEIDTIVALELDAPASRVQPVRCCQSLTRGGKATASNTASDLPDYCCDPQLAVDDDFLTRWAACDHIRQVWLQVDLGAPTTFRQAFISEAHDRVREFELQFQDGDAWRVFAGGTTIGGRLGLTFAPVTARFVRLNILKSTGGPSIIEFQLFP
jgi:alpha-L-fucosidase